jgi:hypothetical protein
MGGCKSWSRAGSTRRLLRLAGQETAWAAPTPKGVPATLAGDRWCVAGVGFLSGPDVSGTLPRCTDLPVGRSGGDAASTLPAANPCRRDPEVEHLPCCRTQFAVQRDRESSECGNSKGDLRL